MASIAAERYPWINRELIESALKSSTNENTDLIAFQLYEAVGKGENYTSHMIRVSVQYTRSNGNDRDPKQTAFVIKTTLSKEIHDKIEKVSLFAKEVAFYRDILPKFDQYTKLVDPGYKCSPRCFQINKDPLFFVFEDLLENKYRNMNRSIGLNFEATEMVLIELAKFHAIGTVIYEQCPELFIHHRKSMFNSDSNEIIIAFTSGIKNIQSICLKWKGYEHYSTKLSKLLDVILKRASLVFESDSNTFNTLTHGDLWVNNIMFKFDDTNNPIDVIMVDYQVGCYGSPVIDLSYLLFTSTTNDLYEADWDRLIQIYHGELVRSLKAVNYTKSIPTLTDIHVEFFKRSAYAVMMSFAIIAPRHMTSATMVDFDTMIKDPEGHRKITEEVYREPKLTDRAKYLLDYFDRKGFLDV